MAAQIMLCCKNIKIRNEAGLTFLEVLASLAIVAVLIAVLSEFLFNAVRLWSAADRGYRLQHQTREVYQVIERDISTAYMGNYLPEAAFSGNETEVSFWQEAANGLVQVKYHYDPQERTVTRAVGFWGGTPEAKTLFSNISSWKIEYYQSRTENWLPEWQSNDKEAKPSLIRIKIMAGNNEIGPFVIPLKAWHTKSDND